MKLFRTRKLKNHQRHLYYTHYDENDKITEIHCGLANNTKSMIKGIQMGIDDMIDFRRNVDEKNFAVIDNLDELIGIDKLHLEELKNGVYGGKFPSSAMSDNMD